MRNKILVYKEGAAWHKWDIHIHVPGTARNDEYPSSISHYNSKLDDPQIREEFEKRVLESNLNAIGVTDYYSVDNYEKMLNFQKNENYLEGVLLVPNIELRLQDQGDSDANRTVNIHIIFNPEKVTAKKIKNDFINRLYIKHKGKNYYYTDIQTLAEEDGITKSEAEMRFILDKQMLKELLETSNSLAGNYLVAVPNDDFSAVYHNPYGKGVYLYDEIEGLTDIIFSHSQKDVNFWLNKKDLNKKPVLSGSDAHSFKNSSETGSHYGIGEEYTWIKSELSFEGLRQVVYEPDYRVRIKGVSKNSPIESRSNYIKSVELDSNSEIIKMMPKTLPLSSNLTTIIGARSSGKSVLEALIAHNNYVDDPDHIAQSRLRDYKGIIDSMSITLRDNYSKEFTGKILYYPQNFISDLAEKEDTLQKVISDIFVQDAKLKTLTLGYQARISSALTKIQEIVPLYKIASAEAKSSAKELQSFSDYQDLISEKRSLEEKIKTVYEESILSDEDKRVRTESENELQNLSKNELEIHTSIQSLSEISSSLKLNFDSIKENLSSITSLGFQDSEFNDDNTLKLLISNAQSLDDKFSEYLNKLSCDLITQEKEIQEQKSELQDQLKIFKESDLSLDSQLTSYDERSKTLDKQILQIEMLKERKLKAENQKEEKIQNIFGILKDIQTFYEEAPTELEANFPLGVIDQREIKLTLQNSIKFDVLDYFDKRRLSVVVGKLQLISSSPAKFSWDELDGLITEFEELLKLDESVFVKKTEPIDIISSIVTSMLILKFDLNYGTDSLTSMSPGMRGVVLLQVLLGVTNTQVPVLLDQPEDDLDNNTIAEILVPLIKSIASDRQVILVTHNANLVVLTDADEVIVANRRHSDFTIDYQHGPLEDPEIKASITKLLEGGKNAFKRRELRYDFKS